MAHRRVVGSLLSCASVLALSAGTAFAHPAYYGCSSLTHPGTISKDKRCVEVRKTIEGDVVNNATIGKSWGYWGHYYSKSGFFVGRDITGELINNGKIYGLYVGADVEGGIVNNGKIVDLSLGYYSRHGLKEASLTGDIVNNGLIFGHDYAIAARYGTMSGALVNDGAIIGGKVGVFIPDSFTSWTGGIVNSGLIYGGTSAIQIGGAGGGTGYGGEGGGENGGEGGGEGGEGGEVGHAAYEENGEGVIFSGGIRNETGGVLLSSFGPTVAVGGASFSGGIYNDGLITQYLGEGGEHGEDLRFVSPYQGVGIVFTAPTVEGGVTNGANGEIYGLKGPAIWITDKTETFTGGITNLGTIAGANDAIRIESAAFAGGLANSGAIVAYEGDGVFATSAWTGDVQNDGLISGAVNGFTYAGSTFDGNFANTGLIHGGAVAASLTGTTFDGAFSNSGTLAGGSTGLHLSFDTITGGFTNSGAIGGESGDGVAIDVGTWGASDARADIVNEAGGIITGGDTGFLFEAGTVYGDFVNDGTIYGGGSDTGLHIIAGTFVGDIDNNALLQAPSNALHLEIEELDGAIRNIGTIAASDVAVRLAIGNGATFTNAEGGIILGDVIFGGKASYAFVAEDGALVGDMIGEGGDDTVTVEGTHIFLGEEGPGSANNFASFTVEDGGAALMGALFEGDTQGTGYVLNNVGALNVRDGGLLYIDKSTTLNVGSYTQEAGGTVEFFLGAPGGEGFSDLTGSVIAGAGDYGRIVVEGAATLDGAVVGFLDPAFAEANDNLNEVIYENVITANGGISGSFGTLGLIADSSLFELSQIIDGTTLDVTVSRVSLTDIGSIGGIIVNTGGPFDALVSDRSNGIGSGSCGLAGEGWCFNRFAQNKTPGASQVMTDATPGEDPFAWLRTGVRKVGETAAWGRAVSVNGSTDGDANSAGTDFQVAGLIAGIDHVFSPIFMAGVAAQWTTTDIDFNARDDDAEVESFELGLYTSYGDTRLYLNANASVIFHNIEVNRVTKGGYAQADYDGTTLSAFAEVGKTFETYEGARIQPFVAVSYSHLETDDYREIGTGALLSVSESTFDSLKSMVGLRLAYPLQLDSGRKLVPEARVAWVHEFMDDQASFFASVQGQARPPSRVLGEEYSRDTLAVGVGVNVPLSDTAAVFVDYDAGLNNDITTHTVSAGLRVTW